MNSDFLKQAVDLSMENVKNKLGGPFGAVIVRDNEIIGKGTNRVTFLNDPTAHAEIMAIRDACKNVASFSLAGSDIYTSCEPCPMCLAAIYWARISNIYYANSRDDAARIGFDDSYIYDQVPLPNDCRDIKMFKIKSNYAIEVFDFWNTIADKIKY